MSRRALGWIVAGIQTLLIVTIVVVPHRAITPVAFAVGAVLVIASGVLCIWTFRTLGRALTPTPIPIDGAGLRTNGPYRYARHPLYTAALVMGAGFAIAVGTWWTLAALVALGGCFVVKYRWEDWLLRERYGVEWEYWANHTGALPRP
jgi:protein-S-isoprenylcysteine O-methyltransferase Ste14